MSKTQVLLLIGAFLTLTFGSFIYYVITWDPCACSPTGLTAPGAIESDYA